MTATDPAEKLDCLISCMPKYVSAGIYIYIYIYIERERESYFIYTDLMFVLYYVSVYISTRSELAVYKKQKRERPKVPDPQGNIY